MYGSIWNDRHPTCTHEIESSHAETKPITTSMNHLAVGKQTCTAKPTTRSIHTSSSRHPCPTTN